MERGAPIKNADMQALFMKLLFIATGPSVVIDLTLRVLCGRGTSCLFCLSLHSIGCIWSVYECVHVHFHLEVISCVFPVAEHRSVWCGSSKLSPTSRETIRPYSRKPSLSSPLSGVITEPSNSHIYNL